MDAFDPATCEELGHYVYLYIDPRNKKPFYIGKGQGNRVFSHLHDDRECEKVRVIQELTNLGLRPVLEILKYRLSSEEAFLVESTAIDLIDVRNLTNEVRGHDDGHGTRGRVEDISIELSAESADIQDPVILINIALNFRYGMSAQELYDVTRSAWKVGETRKRAEYALAIYRGVVREVFKIAGWFPKGSTMRLSDADGRPPRGSDRWEFVGRVADDPIRSRYVGRKVDEYWSKGAQNPIKYVNCGHGGLEEPDEV